MMGKLSALSADRTHKSQPVSGKCLRPELSNCVHTSLSRHAPEGSEFRPNPSAARDKLTIAFVLRSVSSAPSHRRPSDHTGRSGARDRVCGEALTRRRQPAWPRRRHCDRATERRLEARAIAGGTVALSAEQALKEGVGASVRQRTAAVPMAIQVWSAMRVSGPCALTAIGRSPGGSANRVEQAHRGLASVAGGG